ncbi:unnamed protein product [Amoebophrya sp. A25]|nr:unnamed protein product [Amoebophrya sp. A25]|eukprot:GSA25T00020758001.1
MPEERVIYSLREQLAAHLIRECGLSPAMIDVLLSPPELPRSEIQLKSLPTSQDGKCRTPIQPQRKAQEGADQEDPTYSIRKEFYYLVTRVALISETVAEWTKEERPKIQWEAEKLWGELSAKHIHSRASKRNEGRQVLLIKEKATTWTTFDGAIAPLSPRISVDLLTQCTGEATAAITALKGGEQATELLPGVTVDTNCFSSAEIAVVSTFLGKGVHRGSAKLSAEVPIWIYQVDLQRTRGTPIDIRKVGQPSEGWEQYSGDGLYLTGSLERVRAIRKLVLPGEPQVQLEDAEDVPIMFIEVPPVIPLEEIRARRMPHAAGVCPGCFWKAVPPTESWEIGLPEGRAAELIRHVEECHPIDRPEISPLAKALQLAAKEETREEYAAKKEKQRRGSEVCFYRLRSVGPKKKHRKKHPERYHCRICDINFNTSWGSMKQHEACHHEGEPTKCYRLLTVRRCSDIELGAVTNLLRPEQHMKNRTTGRVGPGAGVRLHKIFVPQQLRYLFRRRKYLRCHKCSSWKILFNEEQMTLQALSSRVDRLRKHVRKCKKGVQKRSRTK